MSRHTDMDVYGDVADVLEALHKSVDVYMTSLNAGETGERDRTAGAAALSSSSLTTSAAAELASTRRYINDAVPRLLDLCTSVRRTLRRVVVLTHHSSSPSLTRRGGGASSSSRAASDRESDAVRVLVTRKLGDVMENAHMMRGLARLQQQQQQRQTRLRPPHDHAAAALDDNDDDDDGPLRMKQLLRVTLYNLEDTERLLSIAYPEELDDTADIAEPAARGLDREGSPLQSSSSPTRQTGGRHFAPYTNGGSVGREGSGDGDVRGRSSSSGAPRSSSASPRGSTHTAPYVRRSTSIEPHPLHIAAWTSPLQPHLETGSSSSNNNTGAAAAAAAGGAPAAGSPTSILARSRYGDPSSASSSCVLNSRASSPRVRFLMDEPASSPPPPPPPPPPPLPPTIEERDASLSDSALAATATPQQTLRHRLDLLSNPVMRRSSTDSDETSRSQSNSHTTFSSRPFLAGEDGGIMQLAPFGYRRPSLNSALPSSSTSTAATTPTASSTPITPSAAARDAADATPSYLPLHEETAPFFTRADSGAAGGDAPLANSATASFLSAAAVSTADVPRGILKTAPSRASVVGAGRNGGASLSRPSLHFGDDAAPSPMSRQESGNSSVIRAFQAPVGLPPRSPRRHDPPPQQQQQQQQQHQQQRRVVAHTSSPVDPSARVVTHHMQRLPGDLWGVILADHRAEVEDVLREDVVDLFNYGESVPVLRGEDVLDVYFTVVDTHLYIRLKMEHPCSLAEPEINMRLNLCSYPLMTGLYEEYFREYRAREFDPIEESSTTLGSSTLRYSEGHMMNAEEEEEEEEAAAATEAAVRSSDKQRSVDRMSSARTTTTADDAADADDVVVAARTTSPLSIETDSRTVSVGGDSAPATSSHAFGATLPSVAVSGGGGASVLRRDDAAAQAIVRVDDGAVSPRAAVAAPAASAASRHPHTVRLPGLHWTRLRASPGLDVDNLVAAFVMDVGTALGVLPSEARATCQEVRLPRESPVAHFVWDNAELYPGAVPLSAAAVDAALRRCPFPTVRAIHDDACAALRLRDADVDVLAAVRDGVRLRLPTRSELHHQSSAAAEAVRGVRQPAAPLAVAAARVPRGTATPPSVPAPSFRRVDSGTSSTSAGAEPRLAVPQPTITNSPRHSPTARQQQQQQHQQQQQPQQRHGRGHPSSDSLRAGPAAPRATPAPEPSTLHELSLVHGVSVRALRQWNPALAELDPDVAIPATVTVYVPRVSSSPARVRGLPATSAGPAAVQRHEDPVDSSAASAQESVAAAAPPAPPLPPSTRKSPRASATFTIATKRGQASLEASSRLPPPLSVEDVEVRRVSPAPATAPERPAALVDGPPPSSTLTTAPAAAAAAATTTAAAAPAPAPAPATASSGGVRGAAPLSSRTHMVYRLATPATSVATASPGSDALLGSQGLQRTTAEAVAGGAAPVTRPTATATDAEDDHDDNGSGGGGGGGSRAGGAQSGAAAAALRLEQELGVRLDGLTVTHVRHGSLAARANMQPGDTLRSVDGQPLSAPRDFFQCMALQPQQQQRGRGGAGAGVDGGEHVALVSAVSSRGTTSTYRVRLPPVQHDGAAAAAAVSEPLSSLRAGIPIRPQQQQQPPPGVRTVSSTARTAVALGGVKQQQQQQRTPLRRVMSSSRGAGGERAGPPTSARTRISSVGAADRLRRVGPPDSVHTPSIAVGSVPRSSRAGGTSARARAASP